MARREALRAAAIYHVIVALILLVLGGGMLGLGIWVRVSNSGGPIDLNYTSTGFFNIVLRASVIAIVIGCALIVLSIASLIALSRKCVGKVFRVIYILMALVVLVALLFVAIVCFVIVANRDNESVQNVLRAAWKRTVLEDKPAICDIQYAFDCRGFTDPTCRDPTECVSLCPKVRPGSTKGGCYFAILDDLRKVYLPLGIVSLVVCVLVAIDVFVTCAL